MGTGPWALDRTVLFNTFHYFRRDSPKIPNAGVYCVWAFTQPFINFPSGYFKNPRVLLLFRRLCCCRRSWGKNKELRKISETLRKKSGGSANFPDPPKITEGLCFFRRV